MSDTYQIDGATYRRLGATTEALTTVAAMARAAALDGPGIGSESYRLAVVVEVLTQALADAWQAGIDDHVDHEPEEGETCDATTFF